nr:hypothetical protein [Tanacetum cinerariifolium]
MKEVLNENERLLEQATSKYIVNLVEKDLVITALKDTLSKLRGKAVVDEAVTLHPIDPELLRIDVAPLAPKLRNNRTAHHDYLKHTQEETATLREIDENERLLNPLNTSLDYACNKLMDVSPVNKNKNIRVIERITSSENTPIKTTSSSNAVSNKPMLSSTGVNLLTSASGSQPPGNTKKDRIQKPIPLESNTSKPMVTLVYSRKPKESRNNVPVSNSKINKSLSANKKVPNKYWGSTISNVPSSSTVECRRTRRIVKTIRVDFDELTAMASEQSSSGPALHEMTPTVISSGLVPKPTSSTPFVPPSRNEWDLLFQLMFDELLTPPSSVDPPVPEVIAPIDVVALELAELTGSPSLTIVEQDAPSPSKSQTTPKTQPLVIPNDVKEGNHDIEVAHMGNDPLFGMPIPDVASNQYSLTIAFLTFVEPKTYKDALTQSCWIEAIQEELDEFEQLEVWKLVPRPDKVMVITLKWIYKVKLDEMGGILKNKAHIVARGYRQEEGINLKTLLLRLQD